MKEGITPHDMEVNHFIARSLKALPQTGFVDMTAQEFDEWDRGERMVSHEIDKMLENEALELRFWQQEVRRLGTQTPKPSK